MVGVVEAVSRGATPATVRHRISPPHRPGFRLVAVAVALAGALTLSAAAGWLAWLASDTMPTEAQASTVAATALPGLPAGLPQRHDEPLHHDILGMSTSVILVLPI